MAIDIMMSGHKAKTLYFSSSILLSFITAARAARPLAIGRAFALASRRFTGQHISQVALAGLDAPILRFSGDDARLCIGIHSPSRLEVISQSPWRSMKASRSPHAHKRYASDAAARRQNMHKKNDV